MRESLRVNQKILTGRRHTHYWPSFISGFFCLLRGSTAHLLPRIPTSLQRKRSLSSPISLASDGWIGFKRKSQLCLYHHFPRSNIDDTGLPGVAQYHRR